MSAQERIWHECLSIIADHDVSWSDAGSWFVVFSGSQLGAAADGEDGSDGVMTYVRRDLHADALLDAEIARRERDELRRHVAELYVERDQARAETEKAGSPEEGNPALCAGVCPNDPAYQPMLLSTETAECNDIVADRERDEAWAEVERLRNPDFRILIGCDAGFHDGWLAGRDAAAEVASGRAVVICDDIRALTPPETPQGTLQAEVVPGWHPEAPEYGTGTSGQHSGSQGYAVPKGYASPWHRETE